MGHIRGGVADGELGMQAAAGGKTRSDGADPPDG